VEHENFSSFEKITEVLKKLEEKASFKPLWSIIKVFSTKKTYI
jgi:hypothetical protein